MAVGVKVVGRGACSKTDMSVGCGAGPMAVGLHSGGNTRDTQVAAPVLTSMRNSLGDSQVFTLHLSTPAVEVVGRAGEWIG